MRITKYRTELDCSGLNILVKEASMNYNYIKILNTPEKIFQMFCEVYALNRQAEEYLYMLAFNTKCKLLGVFEISHGTGDKAIINPREIFIRLLLVGANSFVLVHNHPSDDCTPSKEDLDCTNRIKECGKMIGIELLDHIIIGDSYFSFIKNG